MAQLVKQPTRGFNTLYLVVTNQPDSFRRVETLPRLSDHDIVFTEVNINPQRNASKNQGTYHYTGEQIGEI
jgi:hypothetical protein